MTRPKKNKNDTLLFGLVLAGGRSSRMHTDKTMLVYHDKPQLRHTYDLLRLFCQKVFISNRPDQQTMDTHAQLPRIHDTYQNIGPLGGILTAMDEHTQHTWLILACDLPLITEKTLGRLIEQRDPDKLATAFQNPVKLWPEPLCAIYEPGIRPLLKHHLNAGLHCPRKILMRTDIHLLHLEDTNALLNANDTQEFQNIKKHIQSSGRS